MRPSDLRRPPEMTWQLRQHQDLKVKNKYNLRWQRWCHFFPISAPERRFDPTASHHTIDSDEEEDYKESLKVDVMTKDDFKRTIVRDDMDDEDEDGDMEDVFRG